MKFDSVVGNERENRLMETAMEIMNTYAFMCHTGKINLDCIDVDSRESTSCFIDWAREFENTYFGTDEYEDDYLSLVGEFATKKIEEFVEEHTCIDEFATKKIEEYVAEKTYATTQKVATLMPEAKIEIGGESIEIWRWGVNDYEIDFIDGDCSVRGPLAGIVMEIEDFIDSIKWAKLAEKIKEVKCDIKEII